MYYQAKSKFQPTSAIFFVCSVLCVLMSAPAIATEPLTEILVTAEFLESNVLELPNSVTVIDHAAIAQRHAQHLEDLLNLAPNVNFASGASRGRFIQIRGIGERSEFQEPIINSVGVVIDGIDFTGIATAASTLDVAQVEVLRGPQGTLFGANALAGLIHIVSNRPSTEFSARATAAVEEFGGLEWSGVVSGPATENSAYRLALKHYESDGFTDNVFLQSKESSKLDETTARLRYVTQAGDSLDLDFTLFLADIDNGYDAFSLDNTRQTYSDQPGVDQQDTIAGSLRANYQLSSNLNIEGLVSVADSELQYSYDEDWSHPGICDNTACDSALFGFDWYYSSSDSYQRDNRNTSIDLKLISEGGAAASWVLGVYHRDQGIDLDRVYTFADTDFASKLDTTNTALYGQVDFRLSTRWALSTGLRTERRDIAYADNAGFTASPSENLWGGRIAIEYMADSGAFYYGLISRGYKPGGFNLDGSIAPEQRQFDTESMINYELGFKHNLFDDALRLQLALFYQDRNDIQSKQSIVASIATGDVGGICPCSFTDFTDNATTGSNKGVEVEFKWSANDRLQVFGSLGLLDTKYDGFVSFEHVNADRANGIPFNLQGREQAHAPAYQWVIGGNFAISPDWQISGSVEAKDDFYFSDRHDERSLAYELLNLELAYQGDDWRIALYGKNLTDELVLTRGFGSFGNDPRKFYQTEAYHQFAAPRVVGLRASMDF
ncbi:MAG: TonB-dependent receptor [Gammaproteobacteria bacterium]|nr:TonB-dependent receptor [Gammaproteobacteria bacterium]